MQSTVDIQLPEKSLSELRGADMFSEVLHKVLMENREKIGYSIQDYHSREKVRVIDFSEVLPTDEGTYKANVRYSLEQFSVCSAMDSTDYTSMELTIQYLEGSELLRVRGEYAPEI